MRETETFSTHATASSASIDLRDVHLLLPSVRRLSNSISTKNAKVGGTIVKRGGQHFVHALDGINLRLQDGERIGLVGHNGAGKTSLMRMMCGIYKPSLGQCHIKGSVSSLFSSTIGLDQNATGYENIKFASILYGVSRSDHERVANEVRDFSELGDYLNLPIRTYSSGMKMRLGFSIVTSMRPEILIIDEVLTTGDKAFAIKAKARVIDFAHRAKILVVASHSPALLRLFCTRALWMDHGKLKMDGDFEAVWAAYDKSRTV